MTSFDTPDILMPLDEYYAQCVEPKPIIPKRYGFNVDKKQRQAARLQSYKDNPADENEIEDDEEEQGDELNSSIQESNMNQISFETNDFNQLYEEAEEQMDTNNAAVEPQTNIPASSAQWRIKRINLNRPQGAPPLIPRDAPRNQPRNRNGGVRYQNRQQNKRRFYRNNNNNNNNNNRYRNNSVHNRLGYNPNRNLQRGRKPTDLRLRNAYMGFKNGNNNNTKQQQQQVLMNINGHFQSTRSQLNVSSSLNSNDNLNANAGNNLNNNYFQSYKKQTNANWQLGSNSLAGLINSSNQIRPSTEMQNNIMANNFANNNILNNNTNNMTNINPATRLDANLRTNSMQLPQSNNAYNVAFGQPMNQLNSLSYRGSNGIVASDSLRLADLMNMDANSCANLNVAEVAKNAMMLLSTVFHKPILDEDVQQELSHIQKNNGLPEEPDGVDLNINPETTELRMYHRFK